MSSTSHSCKTYYHQSEIVAHEQIAEATWRIRVDCPNLAMTTRPGQFAMVRITGRNDPLLPTSRDIRCVPSASNTRPLATDVSWP